MSMIEHSDNGVAVVEYDSYITVEDNGVEVARFGSRDPKTVNRVIEWAEGYTEAKKKYE